MKTEVYSWRVSADVKSELAREARRRNLSLSALLDLAARELLAKRETGKNDDEGQVRLHTAAMKCIGAFDGGDPHRSQNVGAEVRKRLRLKYARR